MRHTGFRVEARRLTAAVMAAVLIALCAGAAGAEGDTTVFIPDRIEKLGLPGMPEIITLKTETDRTATYGNPDDPDDPCPVLQEEGAEIRLKFSPKPDWAGVTWSDGWENLDVDDEGRAVTSTEGHGTQAGMRASSGPVDPRTGKPEWRWNDGGDYAFAAGLDRVTCEFGRNGGVNWVEERIYKDFFRTGMEGAVTVIRWEPVSVKNRSEADGIRYETTVTGWFVSSVTAEYPAGSFISRVRAEYRNDRKNTLSGYTVTYAVGEDETYAVTYAPADATILEEHHYGLFLPVNDRLPSAIIYTNDPNTWEEIPSGYYLHHMDGDEPVCGELTLNGKTYVTGSGDKLEQWFEAGHGRQLKKRGLRTIFSFPSPRVR